MASNYPPQNPYGPSSSYGSFVPQQGQGYSYPPPQQPYQAPQQGQGYSYPPPQQNYAYQDNQGFGKPQESYDEFQQPPMSNVDYESGGADHRYNHSNKFVEATGWRDLPFFIIFLLHFLGVGAILIAGGVTYSNNSSKPDDTDEKPLPEPGDNDVFGYFLLVATVCACVSLVLAYLWLLAVQLFAKYLIKCAMIFSVVLLAALAVFSFAFGSIFSGIILSIFAVLMAFFYFAWRSRIRFATRMLVLCGSLVQKYPGTARVAYLGIVIQLAWNVFWAITLVLSQQYVPALSYALGIFLLFSLYWTCQVIKNVVHVTVAGTIATWYFLEGAGGVPPNPTLKSLKRACTTSIGSICLGSMIIALIRTLRALANMLRHDSDNFILCMLAFIATCILDMIDALMQYFNQYAYAQVAIYGKTYCQAARDTWDLVHTHGVEAIINDNLIGNVTTMACFISGAAVGTFGAVLSYILRDQLGGDYWLPMFLLMFLVGFLVVMITLEVVESAVVTIFVCFAEDPHALKRNSPKVYKKLKHAYEERCTLFD